MKVLLLGATGRLGAALALRFPQAVMPGRESFDFENPQGIPSCLEAIAPTLVINAVGYTDVERAEHDTARAFQVNATTPSAIAQWTSDRRIPFVSFTSDYVFDGTLRRPLTEDDPCHALNVYGETKIAFEGRALAMSGPSLIFRTSWLYGGKQSDFGSRLLKALQERENVVGLVDEISAPTCVDDLAAAVAAAVKAWNADLEKPDADTGPRLYHLASREPASRFDWASEILRLAQASKMPLKAERVQALSSKNWKSILQRPSYSYLDCRRIREELGIELPSWKTSLESYWKRAVSEIRHSRFRH